MPGLSAACRLLARHGAVLGLLVVLLATVSNPVFAACSNRWALTVTTPVTANGVATSAIKVTYTKNTSFSVTVFVAVMLIGALDLTDCV